MLKSSTFALSIGSPNCDLPIQSFWVLPRLDGFKVMLVLVATATPLMYRVPVVPESVTATCDQTPIGSRPGALGCCSGPLRPVVIAKRMLPPLEGVRNMYVPVPVPISNMRDHAGSAVGLTHAEIVKSCSPLTMLLGSCTNSPVPHRF